MGFLRLPMDGVEGWKQTHCTLFTWLVTLGLGWTMGSELHLWGEDLSDAT